MDGPATPGSVAMEELAPPGTTSMSLAVHSHSSVPMIRFASSICIRTPLDSASASASRGTGRLTFVAFFSDMITFVAQSSEPIAMKTRPIVCVEDTLAPTPMNTVTRPVARHTVSNKSIVRTREGRRREHDHHHHH